LVEITLKIEKVIWKQPRRGTIFEGVVIEDGTPTEGKERVVVPGYIALGQRPSMPASGGA